MSNPSDHAFSYNHKTGDYSPPRTEGPVNARMTDRERAINAIRRGVPLGEVVKCSCYADPPTRKGCFGVCEDSVAAIIASYEDLRREIATTVSNGERGGAA